MNSTEYFDVLPAQADQDLDLAAFAASMLGATQVDEDSLLEPPTTAAFSSGEFAALFGDDAWELPSHLSLQPSYSTSTTSMTDFDPSALAWHDLDLPLLSLPSQGAVLPPAPSKQSFNLDDMFDFDADTGSIRLSARFLADLVPSEETTTSGAGPSAYYDAQAAAFRAMTPESLGSPISDENNEGYYSPSVRSLDGFEAMGEQLALPAPAITAGPADFPSPPLSTSSTWESISRAVSPVGLGTVDVTEILGKRPRGEEEKEQTVEEEQATPAKRRLRSADNKHPSPVSPVAQQNVVDDDEQEDRYAEESESEDDAAVGSNNNSSRPFACTHKGCGLRFRRKFNRDMHELTHTDSKPFVCKKKCPTTGEVCTDSFRRAYDLKRHQTSVHNHRKGEVKKRCLCGKAARQAE